MSVRSPCISICNLDYDLICVGCFRHIDEINDWREMSEDEKLKVLERTEERKNSSGLSDF